jgi:hypothetical protein
MGLRGTSESSGANDLVANTYSTADSRIFSESKEPAKSSDLNMVSSTVISNAVAFPGGNWWIKERNDSILEDGIEVRNLVT